MRFVRSIVLAGLLAVPTLAVAAGSQADEKSGVHLSRMTMGFTYFNKPGATVTDHHADVEACVALAARTRSFDQVINNGAGMGLAGALIGGALGTAYYHGTVGAGLENCMVVRGWRVVRMPDADGQVLAALSQADLTAKLAPWVGSHTPDGTVIRAWANDAANASVPRFAIRPDHQNDGPLSLKAATGKTLDDVTPPTVEPLPKIKLDKNWPAKPVKAAEVAAVTPQAAVVLVRVANGSMKNGNAVSFARLGPDPKTPASSVDQRPDLITFAAKGSFVAFPIAPGRWRMSALGLAPVLGLCLGSPSFEAKAGDVIYLGSFDLGAEAMGPDLDLAPAKAFFAGQPAAESVKPAAYVNGSTSSCTDPGMYAFEVSGIPFEEGYAFGGAQKPGPATTAAAPGS